SSPRSCWCSGAHAPRYSSWSRANPGWSRWRGPAGSSSTMTSPGWSSARSRRRRCAIGGSWRPPHSSPAPLGPGRGIRRPAPARAVLALPLLDDDAPIGVLSIGNRAPRVFEREEIEVFRAAADLAAVALERARLHAQAAEAVRVRERVRIANELHDTLGQLAFSVGLKLDWCLHRTEVTSSAHPKLEEIRHDTGLMMAQIRQLI